MVGCQINILQEDGTVVVSHTGTEIGQGINTKVVLRSICVPWHA
jgi:xanthine dehydrogenase molybdopterin-binding subunit B